MKSTQAMRDRCRELSKPEQDDYDRAVICILDDLEAVLPPCDWKFNCLSALKLLHEALDVIEAIDSECLLPGQLKDMVDAALAPRRNGEVRTLGL